MACFLNEHSTFTLSYLKKNADKYNFYIAVAMTTRMSTCMTKHK